ncbi:hypothetical protein TURU_078036 [Turdus rufiventris]|nr:hypothetical protein TURU_078036 [Turdus rufiventris]
MTEEQHSDALFSFSLFHSLPLDELGIRNEQQKKEAQQDVKHQMRHKQNEFIVFSEENIEGPIQWLQDALAKS